VSREDAGGAPRGRGLPAAITAAYFLCAALFVTLYTLRTVWVLPWGMTGFTYGQPPYPFRYRVLVPLLAKNLAAWTHVPLAIAYAALATFAVFGLLLVYDRYLAQFTTRRDTARVLALGILYPLAWNYCGLNLMYFPFDLPGVFFFTAALLALSRGRWAAYYPLFALATVNRETTWFFTVVFLAVWARRMPARALALHVLAQAGIWIAIKAFLFQAYAGAGQGLFANMIAQNLATFRGMLTLGGTGLKDWAKLLLMFGSLWLALPFVLRGRPEAVRRALLSVPVFIVPMLIVGTIDEARVYGELIPLITTPVLLYLASRLETSPA
jgi:hypothetical protein